MLLNTKKTVLIVMLAALGLNAVEAATDEEAPVYGARRNFTEEWRALQARIDFGSLPFARAIKTIKGKGTRKLAVFSDPDCRYCQRLERDTLRTLDDVTIYTFLLPLDQHADAARKAALIWCAGDKSTAWTDWMQKGTLPAAGQALCRPPLEANLATSRLLGISGTPTLILQTGEIVPGAISKDALEAKLRVPVRLTR